MKDSDRYFAGSFKQLISHWNDLDRAKKFLEGGTRVQAVHTIIKEISPLIENSSWIDIATGAGFIQQQVPDTQTPSLFVGLDFSEAMLRTQSFPYGERVLGSLFNLPFRKHSFQLISNFFCLSDYPELKPAYDEMTRICNNNGKMIHVDYAKGDAYWEARKELHGQTIDGKMVIGNIHLRGVSDIEVPDSMNLSEGKILEFQVESKQLLPIINEPKARSIRISGEYPRSFPL